MYTEPQEQLSTESLPVGEQQNKQQDGRPIPLRDHLPGMHQTQVNTVGNQTCNNYLNDKYLPAYSTDGGSSDLIFGVSSFKDLDHEGYERSIEKQLDNLKLQVFSGESGNQKPGKYNIRTLRKIPIESEDKNYVATVPMSDLDKKNKNCNNVLSKRVIASGNTDIDEQFD
ncbi:unnamed protein product [Mytilus coruscus]|uniref:Uncharacterized protein n=1 Tax=Mytilus coruscus TaxID=42192 RepID=A0A6J8BJQ8_MYTCO|nr:unnamed protein product [Mytilus coruscus]